MVNRQLINGKPASVVYLTEIGGTLVPPDQAKVAIARFDDGSKAIYFVQSIAPKDTK